MRRVRRSIQLGNAPTILGLGSIVPTTGPAQVCLRIRAIHPYVPHLRLKYIHDQVLRARRTHGVQVPIFCQEATSPVLSPVAIKICCAPLSPDRKVMARFSVRSVPVPVADDAARLIWHWLF